MTGVTDSSITIKVEPGMAYSIDGGKTWQTTDTFGGLTRDTMYEIKVKAVETPCYKEMEGPSTMQATEKTLVTFEHFADQTVEYNGQAQTYTLPKNHTGISSMKITGYNGSSTQPVAAGDYVVNIDFVAADGFKLPDTLPAPVLHITRAAGESGTVRPVLENEIVTYTGNPQRYHGADNINGIASAALTYMGIDGTNYPESTAAPTNAGTYSVTAIFTPDANYTLASGSYTATLTILKMAQSTPIASLEISTPDSLTVSYVPGAEYSIDGGETWQDSNTFPGLDPDKTYTILVRMKEDENHLPSGTRPVVGTTTNIPVDVLKNGMPDYSTMYNGSSQPYPYSYLATNIEGVKTVSIMYVGAMANGKPYESAEAPVNVGQYKVRFYLTAEDNYELSADQLSANMTIYKAPQTMDTPPTIANRTTTTITLNPVPGAEYSINGGTTWQDRTRFTGLTPDTTYTFTQRLKATDNLEPSDSQSADGKTLADTGLKYEVDYHEEVIHFDPNTMKGGLDYLLKDPLTDGAVIIPGSSIYFQQEDDGTGKPGPVVMEVLPERPATPDVKVNPYNFTMNTTKDMEYSDDGGKTWHPCGERQLVEDRQGETLLARIAAADDSFKSDACTVTVPVRGPFPLVLIDTGTERMDCTSAMEYSTDNGETWISCLDNMAVSDMIGQTLLVRTACDGVNPASNPAEITVPTRSNAPVPSIDTRTELLTATGTYPEYWTGTEWAALIFGGLDVSELCGQEVSVRESFDAEHFASETVIVKIPGRGEMPDITIDRSKQTIDTTPDMEYSTDGGNTWMKCDKDMDVSDLTGETILVRKAPTDDQFASKPVEVRIPNRTEKPYLDLDTEDEIINTTPDMEYSPDGGNTWYPCKEPMDVSDLTGQTILIRDKGDRDSFPSESVSFEIPNRRNAPAIIVDNHAETVSTDRETEISFDSGRTWEPFVKPLQSADHKGETFWIRYPATRDKFASRIVTVTIPYRHGAPILSFDPNGETIGTTPGMEYSPDGGETWYPITGPLDVSDLTGKDILVRYPSDGSDLPGESTTIKVPARRNAPNVGHTDETKLGRNDGALTDTDPTMEYRIVGGQWTAVLGNTVKNLAPSIYEVRYTATDTDVASAIQTVMIAAGSDTGDADGSGNNTGDPDSNNPNGSLTGDKLALLNRKDHISYISGRTETQAAPNADITRAEVATILYRLLTADAKSAYTTKINRFSDVSDPAWYNTAVSTLANIGVINGYQDGTFGPGKNITRAELAAILARFCDVTDDSGKDAFTDISGSWARQYIN
ncbi:MAG: S-layer homology domain-containing protein [Oscillospiraceae bacterium]|nr:S-layer homology domain-containing protein [Oscillospiraceae bacterium]